VWAGVGDTLKTALVAKKFLINNPANFLVGDKLYFLQGVINSKVVIWYYEIIKTRLGNEGGRFYIYDIFYLPIPLITDANRNIEDEIVTKVKEILSFTGSEDYENNKEKQEEVKNLEREINELVYKLYDLTQDEIKIIEQSK
jgi:adenine-specific DNA-methyltransferase